MKYLVCIIFFVLTSTNVLFSQVSFEAKVSKKNLGLNERLRVDFVMNQDGDNFSPPAFENFTVVGGPNQSVSNSWINGVRSYSKTYSYYLMPKRKGTFAVGQASIQIEGATYKSSPVNIQVSEAVEKVDADTSIIFVPPAFAADAIMEATEAGIKVIITITEGIPINDMTKAFQYVKNNGATLVGPNCPGVITPDEAKVGIMPGFVFSKGKVGIVSKSGTLTYEASDQVVREGLGISTAIGIGGDPIIGTTTKDAADMFKEGAEQEKEWAEYLFKDGSMLGLNKEILCQYVEYITDVRVKAIGIDPIFNVTKNPIPWMKTWLASDTVQVAPQEVEISSYLVGQVDSEVNVEDLGDFEL